MNNYNNIVIYFYLFLFIIHHYYNTIQYNIYTMQIQYKVQYKIQYNVYIYKTIQDNTYIYKTIHIQNNTIQCKIQYNIIYNTYVYKTIGYHQLNDNSIMDMPVECLSKNGFLFLWVINNRFEVGLQMMEKWGYKYVDTLGMYVYMYVCMYTCTFIYVCLCVGVLLNAYLKMGLCFCW